MIRQKKRQIGLRLPTDLLDHIDGIATVMHWSRTQTMIWLLSIGLQRTQAKDCLDRSPYTALDSRTGKEKTNDE